MFKIYGVTDTENSGKKSHTSHDVHDDHGHDNGHDSHHDNKHAIEVDIHDTADHETDIGQIAVDILDTTSSIIIVAPIA